MTTDEANQIFSELGEALAIQAMHKPELYGPRLRYASRNEIRRAMLLWLAHQRYLGFDLCKRVELSPGQWTARQELFDGLWPLTSVFGSSIEGSLPANPPFDPNEEQHKAAKYCDEFVKFLYNLPIDRSDYWEQVYRRLFTF